MAVLTSRDVRDAAFLVSASYADNSNDLVSQVISQNSLATGWSLLGANDLDIDANYFGIGIADSDYLYDYQNAQAFVAKKGKTLAITFRGSESPGDFFVDPLEVIQDWGFSNAADSWTDNWDSLFGRYAPLLNKVLELAATSEFDKVLVSGHSQGGAIAEKMLVAHGTDTKFVGVTFASPGVRDQNASLATRLLNINHTDDFVVDLLGSVGRIGQNGRDLKVELPSERSDEFIESEHSYKNYLDTVRHVFGYADSAQDAFEIDPFFATLVGSEREIFFPHYFFDETDDAWLASNFTAVVGTEFSDDIGVGAGNQIVFGLNGADVILGGGGRDVIDGGIGNDTLNGQGGEDIIYGNRGNDTIFGGHQDKSRDQIYGGIGDDHLYGELGNDTLDGGSGNDTLDGGPGDDTLVGGEDWDTAVFEHNWQQYTVLSGRSFVDFTLRLDYFDRGIDRITEIERLQFANRTFNSITEFFQAHDTYRAVNEEPDELPPPDPDPTPPPSTGGGTTVETPLLFVNNSRASVVEGDAGTKTAQFEINLSAPTDHPVSFIWSAVGGDSSGVATTGEDFKFEARTVVIPAGQVTVFVPVTIYGDSEVEGTESFSFIVSNVVGAEIAGGGLIRIEKGWIIDDDSASAPPPPPPEPEPSGPVYLTIETNDPSEVEGSDGSYVEFDFIVRRTGDLDQRTDYKIDIQGYGGTPVTANDFVGGQMPDDNGSFSPGEDRERFTVRVSSDNAQEAHEYMRAKLTSRDSNAIVSEKYAYAAVLNDDGDTLPPASGDVQVSIRALQSQVVEGNNIQFELTRTGDLSQVTVVKLGETRHDHELTTAYSGDWQNFTTNPRFEIGESRIIVDRGTYEDNLAEPNEWLAARIRSNSDYPNVEFIDDIAEVMIVDDDGPTPPQVRSTATVVRETDGISTAYVVVELSFVHSLPVSMDYTIGGDFAGIDYVARTGVLTIPAGQTRGEIAVQIIGDNIVEGVKQIEVELEDPINGYFRNSRIDSLDTGFVLFDDDPVGGFFPDAETLAKNASDLGQLGKYDLIENTFILDSPDDLLVYRIEATETMTIDTDSPTPPFIFDAEGRLIHANIASFDYIDGSEVDGVGDHYVFTPGEYYFVYSGAYNPVGASHKTEFRGQPAIGDVPLVQLRFSTNGGQDQFKGDMTEGGSDWFRYAVVELSHEVDYAVTLDLAVGHITSSEADFTYGTATTITIDPGRSTEIFRLAAENDAIFEGPEEYVVTVSNVSGALLPGGATTFSRSGTIYDNDENPSPEFEILPVLLDRAEGSDGVSAYTFKITRPSAFASTEASVDWSVIGKGFSPASRSDFVGGIIPTGTAFFAVGETEKTVALEVVGDRFAERDETFEVVISNPSDGFDIFSKSQDAVIRNDDGIVQEAALGDGTITTGVSYIMDDEDVDAILLGGSPAFIAGNESSNAISGNNADNMLTGGGGDDSIYGRDGADAISGGSGDDRLYGEGNDDRVNGGSGNDGIYGETGSDELVDPFGDDTLHGGSDDDMLAAFSGSNSLQGGDGADVLTGGIADDIVLGGAENDILVGDISDFVFGNDVLDGGVGNDLLEGGMGADVFVFRAGSGTDTIGQIAIDFDDPVSSQIVGADFQSGIDRVDVSSFGFVSANDAYALVSNVAGHAQWSHLGTTVVFHGLTTNDISPDDFVFV